MQEQEREYHAARDKKMGSYCGLYIDGCEVYSSKSYVTPEVMTLFRESDRVISNAVIAEDDGNYEYTEVKYRASVRNVTQRLDIMGFSLRKVLDDFESARASRIQELSEYMEDEPEDYWRKELALYEGSDFQSYLDAFRLIANSRSHPAFYLRENPNSSDLVQYILSDDTDSFYWGFPCSDIRSFFRAIVEIAPQDSLVEQDISELVDAGYYEADDKVCEDAISALTSSYPSVSKIIVLTEGKTDREVVEGSLKLLYPHLYDYYSFMDFSFLPPGGAGNLVNLMKSFAGTGLANRVLALFDNDTAAFSAVESLNAIQLPDNIKPLHYPDTELAKKYPTVGPNGESVQDINGLACSIELYYGEDILEEDGELMPIQWKSLDRRVNRYQGVIRNKDSLKMRFMRKLRRCQESPSAIDPMEWRDIDAILNRIFSATHS